MTNWKEYKPNTKPSSRKAKNHCQMKDCYTLLKYKCTPQGPGTEGAAPIYVCEKDMPVWRDKDYKIETATRMP